MHCIRANSFIDAVARSAWLAQANHQSFNTIVTPNDMEL